MDLLGRFVRGSGRAPEPVRKRLAEEGVLLREEGLPASITWRHYRAPGDRASWRRQTTSGGIACTDQRILAWAAGTEQVDLPHRHSLRSSLDIRLEKPDLVCIAFEAGDFAPDRSGRIEIRFRTDRAALIAAILG